MAESAPVTPNEDGPRLIPLGHHEGKPPMPLTRMVTIVGTHKHAHLQLSSSSISKHHAVVITTSEGSYISDLGSRTKVVVNGTTVREAPLRDGDEVRLGKFVFRYANGMPAGAKSAALPKAIVVDGSGVAERIKYQVFMMGSRSGCDLITEEAAVSGRHAIIFVAQGQRYLRDLSSRTGTKLNGTRIRQKEIQFGDQIRVGGTTLRLEAVEQPVVAEAEEEKVDIFAPGAVGEAPVASPGPEAEAAPEQDAIAPDAPLAPAEHVEAELPAAPAATAGEPVAEEAAVEPLATAEIPEPPAAIADVVATPAPIAASVSDSKAPAVQTSVEESGSPLDLNPLGSVLKDAPPIPPVAPRAEAAANSSTADKVDLRDDPDISGELIGPGDTAILKPKPAAPTIELAPAANAAAKTRSPAIDVEAAKPAAPEMSWPRRGWRGETSRSGATVEPEIAKAEIPTEIPSGPPAAAAPSEPEAPATIAPAAPIASPAVIEPPLEPSGPVESVATALPTAEENSTPVVPSNQLPEIEGEPVETPPAAAGKRGRPVKGSSQRKSIMERAVGTRVPPKQREEVAAETSILSEPQTVEVEATSQAPAITPSQAATPEPVAELDPVAQAVEIDFLNLNIDLSQPEEPAKSESSIEEPAIDATDETLGGMLVALDSPVQADSDRETIRPMLVGEEVSHGSNGEGEIFESSVRHETPMEPAAKIPAEKSDAEPPIQGLQLDGEVFPDAKAAEVETTVSTVSQSAAEPQIVGLHFNTEDFPEPETADVMPARPEADSIVPLPVEEEVESEPEAAALPPGEIAAEPESKTEKELEPEPQPEAVSLPVDSHGEGEVVENEVVEAAEVSPESTLDLDLELPPISPPESQVEAESPAGELGDTEFGQEIAAIGGESSGPLVEEAAIRKWLSEKPVEPIEITATAPDDLPLEDLSLDDLPQEDVALSDLAPNDLALDELPPEEPSVATVSEQPIPPTPAPSRPPAAPVAGSGGGAPPIHPVSGAQFISLSGSATFGIGTANFDHFLGGMPVKLNVPPSAPVARFGQTPIRVGGSLEEPLADAIFTGEDAIADSIASHATPLSHSIAGGGPFSNEAFDVASDGVSIAEPVSRAQPPALPAKQDAKKESPQPAKPVEQKSPPMAFDGLAMGAVEKDVFSEFPVGGSKKAAVADVAFGAAGKPAEDAEEDLPPGNDDPVFSASPKPADDSEPVDTEKDFADDEFWNRTDEEEGAVASKPVEQKTPPVEKAAKRRSNWTARSNGPAADYSEPVEPPLPPLPSAEAAPLEAEPSEVPVAAASGLEPKKKRKRRWLIPFLMGSMLVSMGASVAAIHMLVPERSSVTGSLTYLNFNWVEGTQDGNDFSVAQQHMLTDEQTRLHAIDLLKQQHGSTAPGFLGERTAYLLVVGNMTLSSDRSAGVEQTRLTMREEGSDESGDRQRMAALLQSAIDSSAGLLDQNRQRRAAADAARRQADDAGAAQDRIQSQIAALQRTVAKAPAEDAFAALAAKKAQLLQTRLEAEDAVDSDRNALAHLQQIPIAGNSKNAAPDPELERIRGSIADLTGKLQAAQFEQASGVVATRAQLALAAKRLDEQLQQAGKQVDGGSPLKSVIDAAADTQRKNRPLLALLMDNGQDFERQLEDTRRDLEDMIQNRQQEKWAADSQLTTLQADLDSAEHRYNASVGEGVSEASVLKPLQAEIDSRTAQVKARQAELAVDPATVSIEQGLSKLIESLRGKLQKEIRELAQSTDAMDKQLAGLDNGSAVLPADQQEQAKTTRRDLAALADAWQRYGIAVAQVRVAPSINVTDLQKDIQQLQSRFDARQTELAEQMQKSADPRIRQLAEARQKLDADKLAMANAKKTYDALWMDYDNQASLREDAQNAEAKLLDLNDQLARASQQVDTAVRDRDQKAALAEKSFDMKPLSDADVLGTAVDPRLNYSLYAVAGLAVVFAFATFATSHQPPSLGDEHDMIDIAPEQETLTAEIVGEKELADEDDHEAAVV